MEARRGNFAGGRSLSRLLPKNKDLSAWVAQIRVKGVRSKKKEKILSSEKLAPRGFEGFALKFPKKRF